MHAATYLPIGLFVLVVMALLLATAADRKRQLSDAIGGFARLLGGASGAPSRPRWRVKRIVFWLLVLHLLGYAWTYQRAQDAIGVTLAKNGVDTVEIGSLIIPYTAFYRSAYNANAGFSRSRKRARADIAITGHVWSGMDAAIDETGLANINKIIGKKFVFSYLTDVKILRPAIKQHMDQLVRGKQIERYDIETFDNRGPYLIVALSRKNRGKDVQALATALAEGLHTNLTKTQQLKVNQVVIKVVEAEPYIADKTIQIIARGKAGNY